MPGDGLQPDSLDFAALLGGRYSCRVPLEQVTDLGNGGSWGQRLLATIKLALNRPRPLLGVLAVGKGLGDGGDVLTPDLDLPTVAALLDGCYGVLTVMCVRQATRGSEGRCEMHLKNPKEINELIGG